MDILDSYIELGMFTETIVTIMNQNQEDELFLIWLEKVDDKGFDEFKHSLKVNDKKSDEEIASIINDTFSMDLGGLQ